MTIVAAFQRLASAACVFFGRHGSVSEQARHRGLKRQTLYRQADDALQRVEGSSTQQQLEHLRQQLLDSQQRLAECQQQLQQRQAFSVVINSDQQAEFASVGQGEGVSLPVLVRLLRIFLGGTTPRVATLGRLSQDAGRRSSVLLPVLDEYSGPLAQQASADELYSGRTPVLMAVEPDSLCWLSGRLSEQRDAKEWLKEFQRLPNVQQVNRDGGEGLQKGLKLANQQRRKNNQPDIADHLDHFHTVRDGNRALRREQSKVSKAIKRAEQAQKRDARADRRGQPKMGGSGATCHLWRKAEQAFDAWAAQETAWSEAKQALQLFTPEGELNSRQRAQAILASVCARLPGANWAKTRRALSAPETLTFLDRTHKRLAELPFDQGVVSAAVRLEGLRRRPELARGSNASAVVVRGLLLVSKAVISKAGQAGEQALAAVHQVLRQSWRGSSAVEGLNSVLRMQQGRHRRLTQGLVDLKRLYWNCRPLRTGPRKKQSPYARLGLNLPNLPWWQLLKLTPQQLRQHLSAQQLAA
jgi:hypothetical protein